MGFWSEKKTRFRIADDVEVRARVEYVADEGGHTVMIPSKRRRWVRALDAWFAAARTVGGNFKRDVEVEGPGLGRRKLIGAYPVRRTIREKGKAIEYLIRCTETEPQPEGGDHAV